jgi:DGQHR domain-containing protein
VIYRFEGPEDEKRALAWMLERLRDVTYYSAEGQKEAIQGAIAEVAERLAALSSDPSPRSFELNESLWERFLFGVSGVDPDRLPEGEQPPEDLYVWGEWQAVAADSNKLGYSQFLARTDIPGGGGSPVHIYSKIPPRIHWKLTPIRQKAVAFFIGKAKVCEIDAACSVPQLPEELDSAEAGLRVLDRRRGDQEWQRRIEIRRVLSIKNFISDRQNIIANSAILVASSSAAIDWDLEGNVSVDLGRFLRRDKEGWTDHSGSRDHRPIWLIDGQHRVRGLSRSKEGIDLELPIILFPPDFSLSQSAKIFAEINTLQKKLTPLHTLFMQHRFGIPSPESKRDFREPYSAANSETWNSRANHLSYECAAFLTSHEGGPLYGRIRMLDQNSNRTTIIQASQWVDFSRRWFAYGRVYPPDRDDPQSSINLEVENYFSAIVSSCNHGGWTDGLPRWTNSGTKKGLLERYGPSQALLMLYPRVWRVAMSSHARRPISKERFVEVLKPLMWVDWLDQELQSRFGRGGELGRTALRIWMENAVEHGVVYPREEVMSAERKSLPGRGILSPPAMGSIELTSETKWPAPESPIVLRSRQPTNTLPGSKWTVFDSEGVDRTQQDFVLAEGEQAELTLEHAAWMKTQSWFDVRVDWQNAIGPPGKGIIRVQKGTSP